VLEVDGDSVIIDGNHPLAGETLHYAAFVREVRPATEEEIARAAAGFEQLQDEKGEPEAAPAGDLVQLKSRKN